MDAVLDISRNVWTGSQRRNSVPVQLIFLFGYEKVSELLDISYALFFYYSW